MAGNLVVDTINGASIVSEPVLNASQLKVALNASGTAPIYACRAWVNFNGTGTVAIRASGNVSSITDNGVGDYTVNFTTAMPDANYAVVGMGKASSGADGTSVWIQDASTPTASAVNIITGQTGRSGTITFLGFDNSFNSIAIFR